MLQQNGELYSKIKIASEYDTGFSGDVDFYKKYSRFTLKALRKNSFQEFLCWILTSENIEEKIVNAVDIKVYPAPRKNGLSIAGKCDTFGGKIRIYPKTINFCQIFRKKFGKNILIAYLGSRARAALIHEVLHLKYASDEEKVRELTETYFYSYMKKQFPKNPNSIALHGLIFNSKKCSFKENNRCMEKRF